MTWNAQDLRRQRAGRETSPPPASLHEELPPPLVAAQLPTHALLDASLHTPMTHDRFPAALRREAFGAGLCDDAILRVIRRLMTRGVSPVEER